MSKNIDITYHNNWLSEINKYIGEMSYDEIILYCVSYTLQSLRNNEDMERFKWEK